MQAYLGFDQTLVLAVEHTLTFRLWTIVSTWKNCERLALWKRSEQEYDGANGHSCMVESRSLEQIELEQIAELLRERAERNKKKQDIYRATHKDIFKLPRGSGKKTIKRKGEYKRETGKTQTEITSGSTDVEETRKQRILHSTPVKIVENSLEMRENWIGIKLQRLRAD